jgi:glycosyltransferase involved in cell wall biosynthesis
MIAGQSIGVIIPALNEEASIGLVLESISEMFDHVVVVDNGSTDRTVEIALSKGARVAHEGRRGYGGACLRGIAALAENPPNIVLFMDADASDHPEDALRVATFVAEGSCDMCLGSRVRGEHEQGALTPVQKFGNWLSTRLIKLLWKVHYTDLGPLRAITWNALSSLRMEDRTWGWTIEMQIKAAKMNLRVLEIPVRYRVRIGTSKISGTVMGSIRAGTKIIGTIIRYAIR